MGPSNPHLFYEDEDLILPMLLHQADAMGSPCGCRDCHGIRLRMEQIQQLQGRLPKAS
ncbi:hypothetical protein LBMAG39_05600 [Cyanobium sp.]|nr:hypothetical protein LBMAG39_05600 [Cyanobium sp.]